MVSQESMNPQTLAKQRTLENWPDYGVLIKSIFRNPQITWKISSAYKIRVETEFKLSFFFVMCVGERSLSRKWPREVNDRADILLFRSFYNVIAGSWVYSETSGHHRSPAHQSLRHCDILSVHMQIQNNSVDSFGQVPKRSLATIEATSIQSGFDLSKAIAIGIIIHA